MNYKRAEIKDYAIEQIKEKLKFDEGYLNNDTHDIHHDLFNSSYYIIGTYEAVKWLGSEALNIIGFIKEYEEEQFGESNTDFTNAETEMVELEEKSFLLNSLKMLKQSFHQKT